MKRLIRRLSEKGWPAEIEAGFASLLLGPLVGALMSSHKWTIYGAAAGITVLFWVLVYNYVEVSEPAPALAPESTALPLASPSSPAGSAGTPANTVNLGVAHGP